MCCVFYFFERMIVMMKQIIVGMLVLSMGSCVLLAEQPDPPSSATTSATDSSGTTTKVGYIYTSIFDYGADDTGLVGDYDASGQTDGITVGQMKDNGKGWSFQFSHGDDIELKGVSTAQWLTNAGYNSREELTVEMERYDAEFALMFPFDTTGKDYSMGWDIGVKFSNVDKQYLVRNEIHEWDQETLWVGPMIGAYGNLPLGGADSPVSLFGTFNVMVLYVHQKESIINAPQFDDEWTEIGLGANGTLGLNWNIAFGISASAGYRGQILRAVDSYDGHQAFIAAVSIAF
jgi:hypothetical protein